MYHKPRKKEIRKLEKKLGKLIVQKIRIIKESERGNKTLKEYKELNKKLQKVLLKINKVLEEINYYLHIK